ncbi:MAG: UbiH/UbiF/VisC/COQ6 family ubiquinone biosynthesis hydroxylase [Rhodospirillaceae bacterium]|nr:UbiH/UbiF/VisC/COQ6 family ubiquinone biosynthesis hydroxylase [Rhodospirillaceae bacterium]MCY4239189.1 UbiH/UbiF/VisC/COQ6 family ubiquinone biosynthesis hydroxylase [Rhodospirillaceae bacterium]MCY4312030.1 UbiH/UbiF/VisC/COQ6 family ubiquinone biosynthesis hydroxylase [Rhodospirillaceae bacterium]
MAVTRSSHAHHSVDAVIVGSGLVGGALALSLAQAGLQIALIDRTSTTDLAAASSDGRASAIALASQRMLRRIGLWDYVDHAAQPILDIRVSDGDSSLFLHYTHEDLGQQLEGAPFGWIVENAVVRKGLAAMLCNTDRATVLSPAQVTGYAADERGASVMLADGRTAAAPVILAADGAESFLRAQARIPVIQWRYPQVGIVCTITHELPHDGVAHERFLPNGPFAVLPMTTGSEREHRSSIVWTERNRHASDLMALSDDDFSAEIQRRFGEWYGTIRIKGDRWCYPLRLLHAERYVDQRLALAGDAAHTIHPIAGQGLNLGLRDAAALAEVVVDDRRLGLDYGRQTTLRRYERWRRPDNVGLMAVTDGLNRLFSNDIGPVKISRNLGMAAVNRMPGIKRFFMRHAMGTVGTLPRLLRGEAL